MEFVNTGSPSVGSAALAPEEAENPQAELRYLRYLTEANSTGEIRGRVLPASGGIWDDAAALDDGRLFLEWLGFFNVTLQPWIYHLDPGFLRTFEPKHKQHVVLFGRNGFHSDLLPSLSSTVRVKESLF